MRLHPCFFLLLGTVFIAQSAYPESGPVPTDLKAVCDDVGAALAGQYPITGSASDIYESVSRHSSVNPYFQMPPWVIGMSQRTEARHAAYSIQLELASLIGGLSIESVSGIPEFAALKGYLSVLADQGATYRASTVRQVSEVIGNLPRGHEGDLFRIGNAA